MKVKTETADQMDQYFQNKQEFSIQEKLYWYRVILNALLLANEQEKSKEGKRFRYDFKKHKMIISAIKALLPSLALTDRMNENIISLLKLHCKEIREALAVQIEQLFQEYSDNKELYEKENNLKDNPIAGHSQIVFGIRLLHLDEVPTVLESHEKAYMSGCKKLYQACTAIDDEIASGKMSPIRAGWLADLMLAHMEQIVHVYGSWRSSHMIRQLFAKDFRTKGLENLVPQDERDQQMLRELAEIHGVSGNDKSEESEMTSSEHHDCHCCEEHEEHP